MRFLVSSLAAVQVDFIVAFLGVTSARAVAAPLNANYKLVSYPYCPRQVCM